MKYLFSIFYLISLPAFSQQVFDRYYTFSTWTRGNQIIEIPGEGYIVIGVNDSISYDANWQPNNFYIQGILVKLDYNGDTLKTFQIGNGDTMYSHLYGGNSDDFFRTGFVTDDGNILVGGETQSYGADNFYDYDIWLLKLTPDLDTIWTKRYSIPDTSFSLNYSYGKKTKNGGIYFPGIQNYYGSLVQFQITVFDSTGNLVFHKALLPQLNGYLEGGIETINNGFIVVGAVYNNIMNSDLSPIIIHTDSLGEIVWYKILPFSGDMHIADDIIQTQNGNYIYVWGNVSQLPGSGTKVWLEHATEIDINGNEIWTKDYGYSFDHFRRIKLLPNGNFMMTGWYSDTITYGRKAILVICDSSGSELWSRTFSGSPADYIICIDGNYTSDGGFILTGETMCCNFDPHLGWTSSLWVLKTDSLGLFTSVINLPRPNLQRSSLGDPFPNPAVENISISTIVAPVTENAYILLFDMKGRQLQQIKLSVGLNNSIISLAGLPGGEYLIALSIDGFNAGAKKIIKQ